MAPAPVNLGGFLLELAFPGLTFLVDGTQPAGNLLNSAATLGIGNEWALVLPQGLPQGTPAVNLQAAIADPTQPLMFRLTGTVTIETRNTIDALVRNLADAFVQSPRNPLYLQSLMTSDFVWAGASATQFLSMAIQEQSGPEMATSIDEVTVGPNDTHPATVAPAVGAPAAGQTSAFYFGLRQQSASSCGTPLARTGRERMYNLKATEQAGVWKLRGDQAAAEISARLRVSPGASNASGLDVTLELSVWDDVGAHGGIAAISVSGPQLANLNLNNQSTSPSAGTQQLSNSWGGGQGGETWYLNVPLAVTAAGTSRMPLVENATGPRDVYYFQITWNDGVVSGSLTPPAPPVFSGPYALPLRAAYDFSVPAGQAATLLAIPNASAPVLANAGLANAVLALTVTSGILATQSLRGAIFIEVNQSPSGSNHRFEELMLDVSGAGATQALSLCTSYLMAGVASSVVVVREDVFSTAYSRNLSFTF